jgi:hypothetical protein
MSNFTIFCLIVGGMLSVFALIAHGPTDFEDRLTWREKLLRATWPVWPVLLVVGLVRWWFVDR